MKKQNEKQSKNNRTLRRNVRKECACAMRFPLFLNVLTELMAGVLGMVTADTLGKFADAAFELNFDMGIKNIFFLIICLLLVVFAVPFTGMLADFVMFKEALRHDNIIFEHFLDKSMESEKALNSGELQFELEDAPNNLRIYWVRLLGKAIPLPVCLGYFLYSVGKINWIMAGLMLVIAAVKLVFPLWFREKLAEYDREEKAYQAKRRAYEKDIVTRPYLIKLWKLQQKSRELIDELFLQYYRSHATHQITYKVCSEQGQALMNQVTMVLLLFAGALMVAQRVVTPGEFASLFIYQNVLQTFFDDIGEIIQNYPLLKNAMNRVCDLYRDEEKVSGDAVVHFESLAGEQVGYSYSGKKALYGLNFSVIKGEKIRICGANGHGKSTLIKLLCTVLGNYEGRILVNGLDFRRINKEDWRNTIAYAPQIPFLFHETVRENILMGNREIEIETVNHFMESFGILHLADRKIEGESDLSGGEKQKISLIRALVKKAEILILDEPTNHLDQESIVALKNYLRETTKTVIFITHDLSLQDATDQCIQI